MFATAFALKRFPNYLNKALKFFKLTLLGPGVHDGQLVPLCIGIQDHLEVPLVVPGPPQGQEVAAGVGLVVMGELEEGADVLVLAKDLDHEEEAELAVELCPWESWK